MIKHASIIWAPISFLLWITPLYGQTIPTTSGVEPDGYGTCFGGFGTVQRILNLKGSEIQDRENKNVYLPSLDLSANIALRFGCQFGDWTIDYFLSDNSFLFQKEVELNSVQYNSISLHQEVIAFGYTLPLMAEVLHSSIGISFSRLSYELGYYVGSTSTDLTSSEERSNSLLAYVGFSYFFGGYNTLHWRIQKGLDRSNILSSMNQLSLNFSVPL